MALVSSFEVVHLLLRIHLGWLFLGRVMHDLKLTFWMINIWRGHNYIIHLIRGISWFELGTLSRCHTLVHILDKLMVKNWTGSTIEVILSRCIVCLSVSCNLSGLHLFCTSLHGESTAWSLFEILVVLLFVYVLRMNNFLWTLFILISYRLHGIHVNASMSIWPSQTSISRLWLSILHIDIAIR